MNCHKPHNAPTAVRLLKGTEEATCFTCHNSATTNISDIQTDAAKLYAHPVDVTPNANHDMERLENPTTMTLTFTAKIPTRAPMVVMPGSSAIRTIMTDELKA